MCGPETGPIAPSGDLIAIIHVVDPPATNASSPTCRLRLSNSQQNKTRSILCCDEGSNDLIRGNLQIRIQYVQRKSLPRRRITIPVADRPCTTSKYGQLLYSKSTIPDPTVLNPVLHSFFIEASKLSSSTERTLGTYSSCARLDFSAGENGVVGRTVSVVGQHSRVIGEGIIGWC